MSGLKKDSRSEIEKAKEILEKEKKERAENCAKEIEEVLKKYNCSFIVYGQFQGNVAETKIDIIPQ